MSLQILWPNITNVSQQTLLPHELSIYVQISMMSNYKRQLKPHSSVAGIIFKLGVEPVRLTLIHLICLILHSVRHHPSIRIF